MATEIDDSGSHGYDAPLTGTFTTDAANKVLEMGSDGSADTGFTLPDDADWLLVEVYDVNGTAGHIGFTKWQSDSLGNMGTDVDTVLSGYYTTINAEYGDSTNTFKAIATLYDTSASTATVMEADDTAGFDTVASPSYTKTDYTPPTGTWKITDTVVAPANLRRPVWISFGTATVSTDGTYATPNDEIVTQLTNITDQVTDNALVDIDGEDSDITCRFNDNWSEGWTNTTSEDNSMCQADLLVRRGIRGVTASNEKELEIYLPSGTFTVQVGAFSGTDEGDNKTADYTLDGVTKRLDAGPSETYGDHCGTWTVTSSGADYILHTQAISTGYYNYLNGIVITEISA